jgi:phosphotransferase system enzyme I (PtsI)
MSKIIQKGIIASPGIKIGKAVVYYGDEVKVPKYLISENQLEAEIQRFEDAIDRTKQEILEIQQKISDENLNDIAEIFSTHLMALEDPLFTDKARKRIRKELKNAEWVINDISIDLISTLTKIDDEYLRERIIDISDINKHIIGNLQKRKKISMSDINEDAIIIAPDLTPSETALLNRKYVLAFITAHGGKTSHTAIMARSMDIPAMVGVDEITSHVKTGDMLIVDAIHGKIIIDPSPEEIAEYSRYRDDIIRFEKKLAKDTDLPSLTVDNIEIFLYGNLEMPLEMDIIKSHGAQGIGLFRSEFLFLDKDLPDEEAQYKQYRKVVEYFSPDPVTIRTLDYGGDKLSDFMKNYRELNPFLGCRSIRFSLKHTDIFRTQLRAILRASAHGNVKIMYPMISTLDELLRANEIAREAMRELDSEGTDYDKNIEIGIMIEVPSAAITADLFAEHSDFFSIGTNDLVQYLLAVDRVNENVADLYNPLNIAVLRYLKTIATVSSTTGTPVSICGEIAGDPKYTMLLLGLGYRELSMSTKNMYQVKHIIRSVTIKECEDFSRTLLTMKKTDEIEETVDRIMKQKFPDIII